MSKAAPARGTRRSWLWLQGAVGGGIAVTAPGSAILVAVLLCPAIVFYATEPAPGRPVGKIMLLTGSAALFMPLRTLWEHGGSLPGALDLLADPGCPLLAWVSCGAGWLMCELLQIATRLTLTAQTKHRVMALERERIEITEEWTFGEKGPQP